MSARDSQVGGTHYADKPIQPWDAMRAWMTHEQFEGFLRGNAIPGTGINVTMGYWSPAHSGIVNGNVVNYTALFVPCVATTARPTVRVQRSRTIGVGS